MGVLELLSLAKLFDAVFEWAVGRAADAGLDLGNGLRSKLAQAAERWASQLPPELMLSTAAPLLPGPMHENVDTIMPAAAHIQAQLSRGLAPDKGAWEAAIWELYRVSHSRLAPDERAPFLAASEDEIGPHVRGLAEQLASECAKDEAVSRVTQLVEIREVRVAVDRMEKAQAASHRGIETLSKAVLSAAVPVTDQHAAGGGYDGEIDVYRTFIRKHQYAEALAGLTAIRGRVERAGTASVQTLFRVANNIGVCLMGMGEHHRAIAEFRKALAIDPNSARAKVNLAAALAEEGAEEEPLRLVAEASTDPTMQGRAVSVMVAIMGRSGRLDEVDEVIEERPWTAHDSRVQLSLAQLAAERGDDAAAVGHLAVPLQDDDTKLEAHVLGGSIALGVANRSSGETGFVRIDEDITRDQLEAAKTHYLAALQVVPEARRSLRAELLTNLGSVQVLLGEQDEAERALRRAVRTDDEIHQSTLVNLAGLFLQQGRFDEAVSVLGDGDLSEPGLRMQYAAALAGANRWADVLSVARETWNDVADPPARVRAAALVMEAAARSEDPDLLATVAAELAESAGDQASTWSVLGGFAAKRGNDAEAELHFRKALELAEPLDRLSHAEKLARLLAARADFTGAIEVLADLPVDELDEDAAEVLGVAYFNCGRLQEARRVVEVHSNGPTAPTQLIEVAAAIASLAGDLTEALRQQQRAFERQPRRLHHVNQLAKLHLRGGEVDGAAALLADDLLGFEGADDPTELIETAYLLAAVEDPRALDYGFRAWEMGQDRPDVLLRYIGLFLDRESFHTGSLDREVVEPGTMVAVADQGGVHLLSVLGDGDVQVDPGTWFKASSPQAERLLGKRVGDEVVWKDDGLQTITYRVERIASKYVRAGRVGHQGAVCGQITVWADKR